MSPKSGSLSIVCIQLGLRKLPIIRSREIAAKQESILNGDAVGTKVSVAMDGWSLIRGGY